MSRVAIFTDSASDLDPAEAAAEGITIVPLLVNFGTETFKAGVELSTEAFWERMTAPDAPFPTTAASSPGEFKEAYEAAFADGAEAIVSIHVAGTLSGTIKSAQIARDMLPDREIHVVDSLRRVDGRGDPRAAWASSWPTTVGRPPRSPRRSRRARRTCACTSRSRPSSTSRRAAGSAAPRRRSGRCSRSSRSSRSSTAWSRPPTASGRGRRRASGCIELITERPIERLAILHTVAPDVEAFRDEVLRTVAGPRPGERHDRAGRRRRSGRTSARAASARRCCTRR